MATSSIERFTKGLYVQEVAAVTTAKDLYITPSKTQGWFLIIGYRMDTTTKPAMALISLYNNTAQINPITTGGTWTASYSNGVITVGRPMTYMPTTIISEFAFTAANQT